MILDHYTVHTADLGRSRWFYRKILGLAEGYRPPFDGPPGAWLYGPEGRPVVHLYAGRPDHTEQGLAGPLDHIAFRVAEIASVIERLEHNAIEFDTAVVPDLGATQVFFYDPDGIQVELNLDPSVAAS